MLTPRDLNILNAMKHQLGSLTPEGLHDLGKLVGIELRTKRTIADLQAKSTLHVGQAVHVTANGHTINGNISKINRTRVLVEPLDHSPTFSISPSLLHVGHSS